MEEAVNLNLQAHSSGDNLVTLELKDGKYPVYLVNACSKRDIVQQIEEDYVNPFRFKQ